MIVLACPVSSCTTTIVVNGEDPDAALSGLWEHTRVHTASRREREKLFITAQENVTDGTP